MSSVTLINIFKNYGQTKALHDINLEIKSGELFTLLGPSGCGKTTLLRTIAGFHKQDSGSIKIDGKIIDHLPAYRRDTGMVFQDYAIFPHMTVGDNVSFGLKNKNVSAKETKELVTEALGTVRLLGLEKRMPNELSGGQQQRVGLARAMVIKPKVLLMDEPLSNLDAKLRIELREDIREIQKKLKITTIYVTHDQEEALVISDRICIMNSGEVAQVDTPWKVYKDPKKYFVASFVGSMNFLKWSLISWDQKEQVLVENKFKDSYENSNDFKDEDLMIGIRPEDIVIRRKSIKKENDNIILPGVIEKISYSGREAVYHVRVNDDVRLLVNIYCPDELSIDEIGSQVELEISKNSMMLFNKKSGLRCY